jgi:hypothetical protein
MDDFVPYLGSVITLWAFALAFLHDCTRQQVEAYCQSVSPQVNLGGRPAATKESLANRTSWATAQYELMSHGRSGTINFVVDFHSRQFELER